MLKFIVSDKMPLENMVEHIKAHKKAIDEIEDLIKLWCDSHGHKWITQGCKFKTYTYQGLAEGTFMSPVQEWETQTYHSSKYIWYRVCKYCDKEEEQVGAVSGNPFTMEYVPENTAKFYEKGIHISVETREEIRILKYEWIDLFGKASETKIHALKIKNGKKTQELLDEADNKL